MEQNNARRGTDNELQYAGGEELCGREERLETVYRQCAADLVRYACRNGVDRMEAENLVQDTFVTGILRADEVFSYQYGPQVWLFNNLRYKIRDYWKMKSRLSDREVLMGDCAPGCDGGKAAEDMDRKLLMDQCLRRLGEKDRGILIDFYSSNKRIREIAEECRLTEAACKMRKKRALGLLKQWLDL